MTGSFSQALGFGLGILTLILVGSFVYWIWNRVKELRDVKVRLMEKKQDASNDALENEIAAMKKKADADEELLQKSWVSLTLLLALSLQAPARAEEDALATTKAALDLCLDEKDTLRAMGAEGSVFDQRIKSQRNEAYQDLAARDHHISGAVWAVGGFGAGVLATIGFLLVFHPASSR